MITLNFKGQEITFNLPVKHCPTSNHYSNLRNMLGGQRNGLRLDLKGLTEEYRIYFSSVGYDQTLTVNGVEYKGFSLEVEEMFNRLRFSVNARRVDSSTEKLTASAHDQLRKAWGQKILQYVQKNKQEIEDRSLKLYMLRAGENLLLAAENMANILNTFKEIYAENLEALAKDTEIADVGKKISKAIMPPAQSFSLFNLELSFGRLIEEISSIKKKEESE